MLAVKLMQKNSREVIALQKMFALSSPRNRTLPGYFIECPNSYILVMPWVETIHETRWRRTATFEQLLEHCRVIIDVRPILSALARLLTARPLSVQHIHLMHENHIIFGVSIASLAHVLRSHER